MNPPEIFIPRLLLTAADELYESISEWAFGFVVGWRAHTRTITVAAMSIIIIGFFARTTVAQQIDLGHIEVDPLPTVMESFFLAEGSTNTTALAPANVKFAGLIVSSLAFIKGYDHFSTIAFLLLSSAIAYGLWYYATFIKPSRSRPGEPRLYPYWFPFIGHTISLTRDPQGVVTRARKYFGDSRDPFKLYALGVEFAFVTNPKHVTEVYKHTDALTHDVFLEELLGAFRVSTFARQQIFFEPNVNGLGLQLLGKNPNYRSLARLTVDLFREQLQPGPKLDQLVKVTQGSIDKATKWSRMTGARYILRDLNTSCDSFHDISLLNWCEDLLLEAANLSFFGGKLQEVAPEILSNFLEFDSRSWKAMFRLPNILSGDMISYRDKLVSGIEKYFNLPKEERQGANWFIEQQEAEMRNLGISTHDLSRCVAMIFWVINTNAYKLLFWMLNHLCQDSQLLLLVTRELRQVYEHGHWDIETLSDMLKMPYTNALFYECLRVTNSSSSARHVVKDVMIGGHAMEVGMRVLVPYRQIHYDEAVYPQTERFQPSRFLIRMQPAGTVILNEGYTQYNGSYRPFGGGRWLCPGRHIAKIEIFMAMAHLLCRFDVEISSEQDSINLPQMDESLPGIGIVAPVKGTDLRLRVRERKDWDRFNNQVENAPQYPIAATIDNTGVRPDCQKPVDPAHRRAFSSYLARLKQMDTAARGNTASGAKVQHAET